ncbi:MAG: sucrase ferredoxin [Gaiellaceae bacterium]
MSCAELALELAEPLAGTAPVAARWELVEQPKPWGSDHGLVVEGAKVLLVRALQQSVARLDMSGRRYLVCTNGARDPCCAIRGPAVAAALERARPGHAYECSHLGGHRFAANVLVLPDALCFGRLDARSAPALADALDAGRLPLDNFRGRTTLEPEQQAAEILLRRELELDGLGDALHVEGTTFDTPRGRFTVRLSARELEPRRVSCRDDKVESPTGWALLDLQHQ